MGSVLSTLLRQQRSSKDQGIVGELDSRLPKPSPENCLFDLKKLLQHPDERDVLRSIVPIRNAPLQEFDAGVLSEELLNLKIFDIVDPSTPAGPNNTKYAGGNIKEGTYAGTVSNFPLFICFYLSVLGWMGTWFHGVDIYILSRGFLCTFYLRETY